MGILKSFALVILIGIAALTVTSVKAATLIVVDGELRGAENVALGRGLGRFTVSFGDGVDGTCFALFSGCNEPADFTFTSLEDAIEAADALLAQVLLDVSLGDFDGVPFDTFGCRGSLVCEILIPYALGPGGGQFSYIAALNRSLVNPLDDGLDLEGIKNIVASTGPGPDACCHLTFAVFTSETALIPLPAALPLYGTGLAVMGFIGWRRKRRAVA